MAVGYRSGSGNADSGPGTSFTIPAPSGVTNGDLLVAIITQDSDGVGTASLTAGSSGFTQLGTDGVEVGTSPATRCWYKAATGAETGNITFGCDANSSVAGAIACLTGANTASPIDVTTSWTNGTSSTETAPTLTVAAGSMLICGYAEQGGSGHAHSQPTGMTEVTDQPTTWVAMAMDVEARANSGATGTRASTLSGSLSGNWRAVSFAIVAGGAVNYTKTGGGAVLGTGVGSRLRLTLIKMAAGAHVALGSGAKIFVPAPGIVAINTLTGVEALGQLGFTVSTTAVGNAIMVGIRTNSTTLTVSSISGGGCTWTLAGRFTSALRGRSYEVWIGQITAVVSNATATVTWSGDATAKTQSYSPQEFGNGVQSTWTRDGAQTAGVETSVTSATVAWPSLTAAGAGELYFAKGSVNTGIPTATGAPAGFTFKASTDCWAFGIPGSGAISPTSTTSTAATFGGVGALIIATPSAVNIVKTGGAVCPQLASGEHAGSRWTKTGGAAVLSAGVGARQGTRTKAGGAACPTVGIGARAGTRTKSGGAARPHLGVGAKVIASGPKTGGATAPWTATGSKAGFKGPRTGGAAVGTIGAGPARITSDWYYAATASPLSASWAAPELATGPPTGDFATWTGPGITPGVAGTLELAGFPTRPPQVPSTAVPDSVTIKVRHSESPLDQVASVSARAYVGAVPVGASQPLTPADFPHEDEIVITGLSSYADLIDLRVRIIVTRV